MLRCDAVQLRWINSMRMVRAAAITTRLRLRHQQLHWASIVVDSHVTIDQDGTFRFLRIIRFSSLLCVVLTVLHGTTNAPPLIGRSAFRDIVRSPKSRHNFSLYSCRLLLNHGFSRGLSASMEECCASLGEGSLHLSPMFAESRIRSQIHPPIELIPVSPTEQDSIQHLHR